MYHFNVGGVAPISLEKEHGSRDHVPPRYARLAIQGIDDLLNFIEANVPDELLEAEENYEINIVGETDGILPEPEVPDGDS